MSHRIPSLGRIIAWAVLVLFVFGTVLPLWIALKTALSAPTTLYQNATSLWPGSLTIANFLRVLGFPVAGATGGPRIDFLLAIRNSIIFSVIVVTGQITCSALAAYSFARVRFPGREWIFFAILSAAMIPAVVLFIPNFVLIKNLGWLNTFQGMAAPIFLMTPFSVFFLRQFFLTTPRELEEAARIDGASRFRTFWQVVLPVHRSAIATLAILVSINTWNDFFWPFLVGQNDQVRVIAVAINAFREQQAGGIPDWTGLMACAVLSVIPVVIVLAGVGRQVVESVQFSGLK